MGSNVIAHKQIRSDTIPAKFSQDQISYDLQTDSASDIALDGALITEKNLFQF